MKMTDLKFVGVDSWSRPVYRDPDGRLWKDITLGSDTPMLYSSCGNDFDGEPDMPIETYYLEFE